MQSLKSKRDLLNELGVVMTGKMRWHLLCHLEIGNEKSLKTLLGFVIAS